MSGPPDAPRVAGYEIVRELGRGGMGVVWEAEDARLERRVALKVQHAGRSSEDTQLASAQIRAEAKLAARIAHPGVVPIHDAGVTEAGDPYYTMELVAGAGLHDLIEEGPFPEDRALDYLAQLARAVAAAHELGIVHRDLKPANVLVDVAGHLRVLDFGLARRWRGAEEDQAIAGTLEYMSLDQLVGQAPHPAHDVYALGVIFYEMLTGRLPHNGHNVVALVARHLDGPPKRPLELRPNLATDLERLCLLCLERDADKRPTARALAAAAEGLHRGRPLDSLLSPSIAPPHVPKALTPAPLPAALTTEATLVHAWSWTLKASVRALWPLVSNTDRFNKAAGLPAVEYEAPTDGTGVRRGRARSLGFALEWDEHPFEWVHESEHAVYRRYTSGPISAVWNRVALAARDDGSTELVHEVRVAPRSALGRVAAEVQLRLLLRPRAEAVYRRLDEAARALGDEAAPSHDPFEPPHVADEALRARVAIGARRLSGARGAAREAGFPDALVGKLTELLLTAPARALERLRPYALADAWGEPRAEVLDLMLHAANAGLLEVAWDLVCPECAQPRASVPSLGGVSRTGACPSCRATYAEDLAATVELSFRPPRALRETASSVYCLGSPAARPHVLVQQVLAPGEARVVRARLEVGEHRVAGPGLTPWELTASPSAYLDVCKLQVKDGAISASSHLVRSAEITFELENLGADPALVRVETLAHRRDGVTAAVALSHPTLRELMSVALLPEGEHVSVTHAAFLFVGVSEARGLFASTCAGGCGWRRTTAGASRSPAATASPTSVRPSRWASSCSTPPSRAGWSCQAWRRTSRAPPPRSGARAGPAATTGLLRPWRRAAWPPCAGSRCSRPRPASPVPLTLNRPKATGTRRGHRARHPTALVRSRRREPWDFGLASGEHGLVHPRAYGSAMFVA